MEVHTILKVSGAFDMQTPNQTYEPYFSYTYKSRERDHPYFWIKRRTRSLNPKISGTDVYLSFVDKNLNLDNPPQTTVYAHTLCTNRKFAENLPVNAQLDFEGEFTGLRASTLDRPTSSVAPSLDGTTQWKLISHLSLDHLGVCTQTGSIEPLRELIRLYNLTQSRLSAAVEAIQSLSYERTMGRVGTEAWRGFAPLLSVSIVVDDIRSNTQGFFLLSMILHELFKLSGGLNTLLETQIVGKSRNQIIKKWLAEESRGPLL
jgi:type VI secretion system protein ImpG